MDAGQCPDKQTLFGYMMGTISEGEAEIVDQHLTSCQECERTTEALEGLSDTMITALRQPAGGDAYAEASECGQVLQKLRKLEIGNPGAGSRLPTVEPTQKPRRVTRLGDYDLLTKLGQGGMGTVYKARHTRLKRVVALKVLPKNRLEDEMAIARFEREMEAVGRLDHPNIVRAMDAREVDRIRFLVMEYVDGLDLSEVVDRCGPLSIADAAETIRQAALGLECSRENGLVHRDVKPSNLMLTTEGQVKVLDLGLAQIHEAEALGDEVTGVGQVMGTPDYISPEQALESHTVDIRTDVYSLGCTLYCLLVGHPPFAGPDYDTPMKKVTGHIRDTVPPIQALKPDVPKPIARLLERMLEKDPKRRIAGPSEVVGVLAPFCEGSKLIGLLRQARSQDKQDETGKSRIETGELQASAMLDTSREDLQSGRKGGDSPAAAPLDPYHRWLGIPPEAQPANHYRLLGLAVFEDDSEVIRDAAARQMAHVRSYHLGQHAELSQKILNELGTAKACLLNPQKKAKYDAGLPTDQHSKPMDERKPAEPPPVSAEFLASVEERAPRIRVERQRFNRIRFNGKKPPVHVRIAAGAAGLFVFLSVVLYVTTVKGRIKIVLSDPEADVEVRINGAVVEITGPEDAIRLRPDEHALVVTGAGYETVCRSFTIRRGDNPAIQVTLIPLPSVKSVPNPGGGEADTTGKRQTTAESDVGPQSRGPERSPLSVSPLDAEEARRYQLQWANRLGVSLETTNSIGMKLVLIPPGEFDMGTTLVEIEQLKKEANDPYYRNFAPRVVAEAPRHRVRITRPFYLGVYEVTREEYSAVVGDDPSRYQPKQGETDEFPVENVSWNDASHFCRRLSQLPSERAAHRVYSLPTEAQWEYACRAGTTTRYCCASHNLRTVAQYAWFLGPVASYRGPKSVGRRKPNAWGLYDMHGNVWEYCQDWYDANYYERSPAIDPMGPVSSSKRVRRGGSFSYYGRCARSAHRDYYEPHKSGIESGFRVVVAVDGLDVERKREDVASLSTSTSEPAAVKKSSNSEAPIREPDLGEVTSSIPPKSDGLPSMDSEEERSDTQQQPSRVRESHQADSTSEPPNGAGTLEPDFVSLFDGKTLDGWEGSTEHYIVEYGKLVSSFGGKMYMKHDGGNLLTLKEYGDFILQFDFKVQPKANSGVLIRTPKSGYLSRTGMEIQILDDSCQEFTRLKNTQPWMLGIAGVAAPKLGHQEPVGQWNSMEIACQGRTMKLTLNETPILDADLDKLAKNPADGESHPGLKREKGRIGFWGYCSRGRVEYRNLRIKEL